MGIRLSTGNKGSIEMKLGETALAARYAQEARDAAERAKAAAVHPPTIGGNGNWQLWDQMSGYVDSGVRAEGPAGPMGENGKGMYAFEIRTDGHLYCLYDTAEAPAFSINAEGHLIYTIGGGT